MAEPPKKPTRAQTAQSRKGTKAALPDVFRLWGVAIMTVAAVLVFRWMADQPCASPTVCLLPPLYLSLKPLLLLAGLGMVGFAIVASLVALARRVFARR